MNMLKNVRAYLPRMGVVRADIRIENGRIADVSQVNGDGGVSSLSEHAIVLPGFIDEHVHGAGGADAMDGDRNAIETISKTLVEEGTTAFLATTMTQSRENISEALSAIKEARAVGVGGAEVLGVHLEGPFISPKYIGAQPPEHIQAPAREAFDSYQMAAGGSIRLVSLAPEMDGADELIAYLCKNGVRASAGHTAAGYKEMMQAVSRGLSSVTHTYNAQSPVHHREIGVVGTAMLCDALYTELICDTVHVSVPAIALMLRNKPHDKMILITDAMRAKGLCDGVYDLGGQDVYVRGNEARLASGTLAGSVLRMNDAIRNLVVNLNVPLTDAVDFATINPATHLGLAHERGSIEVGKRADLTVLDDNFNVLSTYVAGELVYEG